MTASGINGDIATLPTGAVFSKIGGGHVFIENPCRPEDVGGGAGAIVSTVELVEEAVAAADLVGLTDDLVSGGDRAHHLFWQASGGNGFAVDDDRGLPWLVTIGPFPFPGAKQAAACEDGRGEQDQCQTVWHWAYDAGITAFLRV